MDRLKNGYAWLSSKQIGYWLACILPFLTLLPYFIGYLFQDKMYFTGYLGQPEDQNIYFGFIKQAQEGYWRFLNPAYHLEHPRQYIHTLFLLIGFTAKYSHFPTWAVYLAFKYLFELLFAFCFLHLTRLLKWDDLKTNLGMILILWGGGFGIFGRIIAILHGIKEFDAVSLSGYPVDLWIPMMSVWRSSFYTPLFIWSTLLILAVYLYLWKGEEKNSLRYYMVAAFCIFLLGLSHSYDMVPLFFVTLFLFAVQRLCVHSPLTCKKLLGYGIFKFSFLATLFYQYYVLTYNPGFSCWKDQNVNITPHFFSILLGFGFLSFGYLECLIRLFKEKNLSHLEKVLAFWLFFQTVLLYSPIAFNRQFLLGIAIPLTLFFVQFLVRISQRFVKMALFMLIISLLSPTAQLLFNVHKILIKEKAYFYTPEQVEAYKALNLDSSKLLLSSLKESNRLLRFSSSRMVLASFQQSDKSLSLKVKRIFGEVPSDIDQDLISFLNELSVDVLFLDKEEHRKLIEKYLQHFSNFKVYFENSRYIAYLCK